MYQKTELPANHRRNANNICKTGGESPLHHPNGTGRVIFENFNAFTTNTPVPPKNIVPREPTFWVGAWDSVKTLGPWAFFGYALGGGGLANHTTTTVNNTGTAAQ